EQGTRNRGQRTDKEPGLKRKLSRAPAVCPALPARLVAKAISESISGLVSDSAWRDFGVTRLLRGGLEKLVARLAPQPDAPWRPRKPASEARRSMPRYGRLPILSRSVPVAPALAQGAAAGFRGVTPSLGGVERLQLERELQHGGAGAAGTVVEEHEVAVG